MGNWENNGVYNDKSPLRSILHTHGLRQDPEDSTPTIYPLSKSNEPSMDNPTSRKNRTEQENERMEEDSIASEVLNIPKGCLFDQLRPESPTAVTDFPWNKEHPMTVYLAENLQLKVAHTSKLPHVTSTNINSSRWYT